MGQDNIETLVLLSGRPKTVQQTISHLHQNTNKSNIMHASCDIKNNIYEGGHITYQMTDALAGFLLPHMRPILCILISARSFVFCACILHQCTMIPLLNRSCLKSKSSDQS